jgi:hypothetical protein
METPKITVVTYVHEAHKQWIPFWAEQISKQTLENFRILFIAHNWCDSLTTESATSNYNEFHNLVDGKLSRAITFMSYNGPPVIGDVIDFATRNVKTEFMAHWDIDDPIHPDRLQLQHDFLAANPDIDFLNARAVGFYGDIPAWPDNLCEHQGSTNPLVRQLTSPDLQTHDEISNIIMSGNNCLSHGLMVYRPEIIQQMGGFSRSDVKIDGKSPDFETWKKALMAGYKFHRLPELLMMWRLDSSSIRL